MTDAEAWAAIFEKFEEHPAQPFREGDDPCSNVVGGTEGFCVLGWGHEPIPLLRMVVDAIHYEGYRATEYKIEGIYADWIVPVAGVKGQWWSYDAFGETPWLEPCPATFVHLRYVA